MALKLGRLLMAGHLSGIYIYTHSVFFQLIVISLASITRWATHAGY